LIVYSLLERAVFLSSPLGLTELIRGLPSHQIGRPTSVANEMAVAAIYLTEMVAVYGGRNGRTCSGEEVKRLLENARQIVVSRKASEAFSLQLLHGELTIDASGNIHLPQEGPPKLPRIFVQLEYEKRAPSPSFHGLVFPDGEEFKSKHGYSIDELIRFMKSFFALVSPHFQSIARPRRILVNKLRKKSNLSKKVVDIIIADYETSPQKIAPGGTVEYWKNVGRIGSLSRNPFLTVPEGLTFVGPFMLARTIPIKLTEEVFLSRLGPRTEKIRQKHSLVFETDVRAIATKAGFQAVEIPESECPAGQIDCVAIHRNKPLCVVIECKTSAFVPDFRYYLPKSDVLREWETKLEKKLVWVKANLSILELTLRGVASSTRQQVIGLIATERPFLAQGSSRYDIVTIYELEGYLETIQQVHPATSEDRE